MPQLSLNQVSMKYKNKTAVNHVSYEFGNGVYGLLGANGAGKTTLMRMICSLLPPVEGEILCDGREIWSLGREYRRLLGYLPQEFGYYPDFTGERFLRYLGQLKAVPKALLDGRVHELLELVDLEEDRKRKIKTYSGGMKRRLGIAQALLGDPQILILDEPTAGLDPKERIRFRNLICSLGKNRIVILSTHIVSDIEYIADEILIMKSGSFLLHGQPEEVESFLEGKVWELPADEKRAEEYSRIYTVSQRKAERSTQAGEAKTTIRLVSDERPAPEAVLVKPTLEDVYLYCFQEKRGQRNGIIENRAL